MIGLQTFVINYEDQKLINDFNLIINHIESKLRLQNVLTPKIVDKIEYKIVIYTPFCESIIVTLIIQNNNCKIWARHTLFGSYFTKTFSGPNLFNTLSSQLYKYNLSFIELRFVYYKSLNSIFIYLKDNLIGTLHNVLNSYGKLKLEFNCDVTTRPV